MDQLLLDAKRLMMKLKEQDNAADVLVNDVTSLSSRLKAMKQVIKLYTLRVGCWQKSLT